MNETWFSSALQSVVRGMADGAPKQLGSRLTLEAE